MPADVPKLQELIRARMDERGLTFPALERASGGELSQGRWRQLAGGKRMRSWPEPDTLTLIASTLGYDETTIVLATARALGMNVRARGPLLGQLLPAGTDELSSRTTDAVLALLRAVVADALENQDREEGARAGEDPGDGPLVGFSRYDAPSSRRNRLRHSADTDR